MVPVEEYHDRALLNPRSSSTGTVFFHYWDAIGDFYYYLTLIGPLLEHFQDHKRILLADFYMDRYTGRPVRDLCLANGYIDEVWHHQRKPGLSPVPPEVRGPRTGIKYYAYDHRHMCVPGAIELPKLSLEARKLRKKRLIALISENRVRNVLVPELDGHPFVTLDAVSQYKQDDGALPMHLLRALPELGVQVVALRFPGFDAGEALFAGCGIAVVDILGPVDSLSIQALAKAHIGVESSQFLGAAIHGVPTFYFPFRLTGPRIELYIEDLGVAGWCHKMDWEIRPEDFLAMLKGTLG